MRAASSIRAAHLQSGPTFAVAHAAVDVADEQDHRLRILASDMDADTGVGCTGPARDKGDAGAPGHRAIGTRHEADSAFLPTGHGLDLRRIVQRVEYGEKALAGDMEDAVATLDEELVDENAAAGAGKGSHEARITKMTIPSEGLLVSATAVNRPHDFTEYRKNISANATIFTRADH
jgi:hypothetical protein